MATTEGGNPAGRGRRKLLFLFLGVVGVAVTFLAYSYYKERKQTLEEARRAVEEIRQEVHESTALASLGDIQINPQGLTLGKLNEILRRPGKELSTSGKNHAWLGWACGGDLCTLQASFLVPAGSELPLSTPAAELFVSNVSFGKPFQGSIGGIHLGDPVEKLAAICKQHGYGREDAMGAISYDQDWDVRWTEEGGRTTALVFFNRTLLSRSKTGPALPTPRADK